VTGLVGVDLQERLTRRFGPGVADWCAGLPALTRSLASRWTLDLGEPFPGGNSSVAIRCTRSDGSPAVLKLSPDLPVVAEQVETLRLFGTSGRVPAVLAADLAAGAVLLELIEPGTTARELRPPPSARDWAGLLTALHTAPVPPGYPQDLRAQCEGFFDRIGRRVSEPEVGRWVSAADVARGAIRCEALLSTQTTRVLLHGDLHLANVLDGGVLDGGVLDGGVFDGGAPRRLVAIDPRACVGDPCFDAVDYLLDGAGRDGMDGIDARCAGLATASGLDAARLYDWCRAVAPIVAITYVMRPGSQAAVAELLALSSE
jgi:streptomycin 6-kinase